jgi:glycosyltransferase involved in cell wall biosynthesis
MKFLFITKEYPPFPDASGSIVYHLTDCLKKQGHHVDVIARDYFEHVEKEGSGDVCWIKMSYWEKLSKRVRSGSSSILYILIYKICSMIRKIILMLAISKFPDSEWWITKRTIKVYKKYLNKKKYDCIIGFFRPYSCLSAAMQIAEYELSATCIACYFDIVDLQQRPSFMPKNLYKKLILKGDRKVMDKCDRIMLPVSALKRKDMILNTTRNPVYYEFPTFIASKTNDSYFGKSDKGTINLVFAGTMDVTYRNPENMLEVLTEVARRNRQLKIKLDIFGGGNCEEIIRSIIREDNLQINYHGKVPKKDVTVYEKKADVLINIMNAYEGIVPSKIFELFACCKPILNFETSGDDGSLEYFEKYPICNTVKWNSKDEMLRNSIIEKTTDFLLKSKECFINFDSVKELYVSCTPEYVTEQIIKIVKEEKANEIKGSKNSVG